MTIYYDAIANDSYDAGDKDGDDGEAVVAM